MENWLDFDDLYVGDFEGFYDEAEDEDDYDVFDPDKMGFPYDHFVDDSGCSVYYFYVPMYEMSDSTELPL